ncbi:hypothetical protein MSPP1_003397 [Malassezia sp. CBS 17886]|nr:hypothetical protein MSPP1_003397 [Malassezia sp. CBS 17886]
MSNGARASGNAEVIQEWADFDANGCTFERGRMDANVQSICFKEPAGVPDSLRDPRKGVKVKAADVAFLKSELLISESVADAALVAAAGDVDAALQTLLRRAA